jgi:tetratricopeptide (TPR) repeat protein
MRPAEVKIMIRVATVVVVLAGLPCGVAAGASTAAPAGVEEPARDDPAAGLELWGDPRFRQEFLLSFRPNSEIEPAVTAVEREQMEKKMLPLLGTNPEAARAALEELTTPESSALFDFTLGNLYFQEERLEEAVARYAAAIDKFPSFRRAHKNLGLIHVRTGRFADAIASLSRVIQLGGGEGLTYGLLGYAYGSTEQYLPAESAYRQALLLQPEVMDWKLGLTRSVLGQRKYGEAIALCEDLIARNPERSDYWLLQANAFIGLGRPLEAAQNYEVVRRMGKATPAMMNTLGDIYVNAEMLDLASRAYVQAHELDPQRNLEPGLQRVEVLAQRGALDQAQALLDRIEALAGGPLEPAARSKALKLRSRITVAGGAGKESVEVLEQIVALDPLDGEALILLGQHYARVDEPERAIFYYERAESLSAFEAAAKVRRAQLLVGMARYPEAVPLLERAQELEPRDDVARYLEQVQRLARASR